MFQGCLISSRCMITHESIDVCVCMYVYVDRQTDREDRWMDGQWQRHKTHTGQHTRANTRQGTNGALSQSQPATRPSAGDPITRFKEKKAAGDTADAWPFMRFRVQSTLNSHNLSLFTTRNYPGIHPSIHPIGCCKLICHPSIDVSNLTYTT